MDAEAWLTLSIIGYVIAGVMFSLSIFLFYKLKIPAVIGDLTGKTAAKQIQEIRQRNAATGVKVYKPDLFNLERGKLTEPVKVSGKINRQRSPNGNIQRESYPMLEKGHIGEGFVQTERLKHICTEKLSENQTEVIEETMILHLEEDYAFQEPSLKNPPDFKIIKNIKVTHTKETI